MFHDDVRQYLSSHYMYVDDEWLSGCVEYLTEDGSNNYTQDEIKNLAKEQWLLNDLKDICPGSLPANLKNMTKTVLNGRFVLQINAAVDIGTPAYQQYLKLQKINMENVEATIKFEDKIPSNRMIKLHMTDGVQEVSGIEYRPMRNLSVDITPGCKVLIKGDAYVGMDGKLHTTDGVQEVSGIEYQPMRNLSVDITPGCKVLIKGPVECRRGTLLLTEGAVELLGGEVQEIVISNSLAGLLSSKLGLPITQAPDLDTTQTHPRNTNIPTPHTQMPPSMPGPTFDPALDRPMATTNSPQIPFNDDDDAIDIDQLAAIEAQITQNPTKRTLNECSSNPEKKQKLDQTNSNTETSKIAPLPPENRFEDYPEDNDIFLEEDEDYLREFEANIDAKDNQLCVNTNKVKYVSPEPFVYIKQINEMADGAKAGRVFKVKAQIMKLLSKLAIVKEGWSLKCTIVDGTGNIDVEFASEVLSKLVGFTPQEMNQMKKQMATNPEIKAKAIAALQKAKETLQVLYCIIELTMLEVPKITCLTPFASEHVDLLKKRMENT